MARVKPKEPEVVIGGKLADEYGQLDAQIKALTKRRDELREQFIQSGLGELSGKEYILKLSESSQVSYDNEVLFKLLKRDLFIKCVKPVSSELAKYLSPVDLQKAITETVSVKRVLVKPVK